MALLDDERSRCPDLAEVEALLRTEVESISLSGRYQKGRRRLLLSLTEVKILQCDTGEASALTQDLLAQYTRLGTPDIVDRLGHIRALMGTRFG